MAAASLAIAALAGAVWFAAGDSVAVAAPALNVLAGSPLNPLAVAIGSLIAAPLSAAVVVAVIDAAASRVLLSDDFILQGAVTVAAAAALAVYKHGAAGYYLCEALAIALVVTHANFVASTEHFTWWGMTVLAAHDVVVAVWPGSALITAWPLIVTSATVAVGVVYMSAAQCSMLSTTLDDIGGPAYILGNAAVHYYPLVRGVHSVGKQRSGELCWPGALAAVVYSSLRKPSSIYGCGLPEQGAKMSLIVCSLSIAAACHGFRRSRSTEPVQSLLRA